MEINVFGGSKFFGLTKFMVHLYNVNGIEVWNAKYLMGMGCIWQMCERVS